MPQGEPGTSYRRFQLETLEQRLLLSADDPTIDESIADDLTSGLGGSSSLEVALDLGQKEGADEGELDDSAGGGGAVTGGATGPLGVIGVGGAGLAGTTAAATRGALLPAAPGWPATEPRPSSWPGRLRPTSSSPTC